MKEGDKVYVEGTVSQVGSEAIRVVFAGRHPLRSENVRVPVDIVKPAEKPVRKPKVADE